MKLSHALACLALLAPAAVRADNARFDLQGPKIDVKVTRGTTTLPIAEVPNLEPGDKIWVKADLPDDQRNHLLLIVAFLRGTTNEPPDNWFTEIDTWDKKHTAEGTTVTVPADAQQALLFVAPETGGDFKTLRSAVKGRPGVFIRADADLNEASFEQQRIERYLAAMKTVSQDDQQAIKDHSAKLAATLALKPNADCFKQPVDQQVNCLTQSSAPVLLDDGHGQSIAEALSTGPSSDFINAASYTQAAGAGAYSAYVGAVVDLVHLVSTLRTAKYQYIPGLTFPQGSTLNVRLNAPVSFVNPKSVIVIGLPAIRKAKLPPLRPQHPEEVACLLQPKMPLLLEGAPLVFATSFAHDLVLHVNRAGGPTDIPLTPDAFEGGLVVTEADARQPLKDSKPGPAPDANGGGSKPDPAGAKPEGAPGAKASSSSDLTVTGTVRGYWGFDSFEGPTLTLQQVDGKNFKIMGDTQLLAGQDNHLTLAGDGTACVQHIALTTAKDKDVDVTFKPVDTKGKDAKPADTPLDLDVSLKKVQPGGYQLAVQQYGAPKPDDVPLKAYAGDIHFDALKLHAGDNTAVLTGHGVSDVTQVEIAGQTFTPAGDGNDDTTLNLAAKAGVSPANGSDAQVKLKDGRTMTVKVDTEAPRPTLALVSVTATPGQTKGRLPVELTGKGEIALNGTLTFVVQSKDAFPRNESVEVATADNAVQTTLNLANNQLVLQDPRTAIAKLDPLKAFGQSAFGKLQMRPVAADGTPGGWIPLGTLVRTPEITAVRCASAAPGSGNASGDTSGGSAGNAGPGAAASPACTLEGNNLFLLQSVAGSKDFAKSADVPTGYAQGSIAVPMPADGTTLYLKLRDDPEDVATLKLPQPVQVPTPAAAPASAQSAGQPGASATTPARDQSAAAGTGETANQSGTTASPQGQGQPATAQGQAQPGQPSAGQSDDQPASSQGQTQPASSQGQTQPASVQGQAQPAASSGQPSAAPAQSGATPAGTSAQSTPVTPKP